MFFKDISFRCKLGIAILVLSSLLLNMSLLLDQIINFHYYKKNSIVLLEERFQALKPILPRHGVVSYISAIKPRQEVKRYQQSYLERYYLTQYILSPLIIVNNPDQLMIVGDFDSKIPPSDPEFQDLVLLRNFGNGIMLFERRFQ